MEVSESHVYLFFITAKHARYLEEDHSCDSDDILAVK